MLLQIDDFAISKVPEPHVLYARAEHVDEWTSPVKMWKLAKPSSLFEFSATEPGQLLVKANASLTTVSSGTVHEVWVRVLSAGQWSSAERVFVSVLPAPVETVCVFVCVSCMCGPGPPPPQLAPTLILHCYVPPMSQIQHEKVFTHWGVRSCPANTTVVLLGDMVTAYYTDRGSSGKPMCVTSDPDFGYITTGAQTAGRVTFARYYWESKHGSSTLLPLLGRGVPCAVCSVDQGQDVFTMYGSTECSAGYTVAYAGYLMGGSTSYSQRLVCLDQESVASTADTSTVNNEGRVAPVELVSPMSGYSASTSGREMTCAVCMRARTASTDVPPLQETRAPTGVSYVRFGSTTCPDTSNLVYRGAAFGRDYNKQYGPLGTYCATFGAQWLTYVNGNQGYTLAYQSKYATSTSYGISAWNSIDSKDVPCVRCEAPGQLETRIFPAKTQCPTGWQKEYSGMYLTSYYSHARGDFVCVDLDATGDPMGSGSSTSDSNLLYPLELESYISDTTGYATNRELPCTRCSTNQGLTYVRYGRATCPSDAELVYSGWLAGPTTSTSYSYGGSGSQLLCMPMDADVPETGYSSTGNQNGGWLYVAQYATSGTGISEFTALNNEDVPCAVCMTKSAKTVFTQHGSVSCPRGYRASYSGYLFSSAYNNWKQDHICVDRDPIAHASGSSSASTGAYIYPMYVSGSYVPDGYGLASSGWELTCAVCETLSNAPPTISNQSVVVQETVEVGGNVGSPLVASDPDAVFDFSGTAFFDLDTFESADDVWAPGSLGTPVITNSTAYRGNHSLYLQDGPWGICFDDGYTEPGQAPGGYDTDTYPYICMAYKVSGLDIVT